LFSKDEEESLKKIICFGNWSCRKKPINNADEHDCDLNSQDSSKDVKDENYLVPEGDKIEAVQSYMRLSVDNQQKAIKNWVKLGLKLQMIQAFNMLNKINDGNPDDT